MGELHVFAYETFESSGEDAVLYIFHATGPETKVWGRVRVVLPGKEPKKAGPYQLEIEVEGKVVGEPFQMEQPSYPVLKERIRALVDKHILPIVK